LRSERSQSQASKQAREERERESTLLDGKESRWGRNWVVAERDQETGISGIVRFFGTSKRKKIQK